MKWQRLHCKLRFVTGREQYSLNNFKRIRFDAESIGPYPAISYVSLHRERCTTSLTLSCGYKQRPWWQKSWGWLPIGKLQFVTKILSKISYNVGGFNYYQVRYQRRQHFSCKVARKVGGVHNDSFISVVRQALRIVQLRSRLSWSKVKCSEQAFFLRS